MNTYTFFSPDNLNRPLGVIDNKGHIIRGVTRVDAFIISARKGSASNKENNFLCIADVDQPTEIDVITLGELLGRPSKPKDENRVSDLLKRYLAKKEEVPDRADDEDHPPSAPIIKSGNRYMSKLDWSGDRVKNQIQDFLSKGKSLAHIARHLGVSRSTLTKANKRHNYRLYVPDLRKVG